MSELIFRKKFFRKAIPTMLFVLLLTCLLSAQEVTIPKEFIGIYILGDINSQFINGIQQIGSYKKSDPQEGFIITEEYMKFHKDSQQNVIKSIKYEYEDGRKWAYLEFENCSNPIILLQIAEREFLFRLTPDISKPGNFTLYTTYKFSVNLLEEKDNTSDKTPIQPLKKFETHN